MFIYTTCNVHYRVYICQYILYIVYCTIQCEFHKDIWCRSRDITPATYMVVDSTKWTSYYDVMLSNYTYIYRSTN